MTLLGLLVALIIIGLLLYLVGSLPLDPAVKTIIRVVVIIAIVLWLAESLGAFPATGLGLRLR